jgi:hypothetical protein
MVLLFDRVFLFGDQKGEIESLKICIAGDKETAKSLVVDLKRQQYKRQIPWVFIEEPTIVIIPREHQLHIITGDLHETNSF